MSRHLPEGTDPPAELPPDAFRAALHAYEHGERLDMGALAATLGISRATLYRRVGSRDRLIGAVLWWRSRQVLAMAIAAAGELHGAPRVLAVLERYLAVVHARPQLEALMRREPEAGLRIVTSRDGLVHTGLRRVLESLLAEEEERGTLRLTIDRETLAYVVVRIGESLVYADRPLRGDRVADVRATVEVVARLLAGSDAGALPAPQEAPAPPRESAG